MKLIKMNYNFTMIILFVLGSFFISKTNAQTVVTGIITDVNTGETLPGVTVKIAGYAGLSFRAAALLTAHQFLASNGWTNSNGLTGYGKKAL